MIKDRSGGLIKILKQVSFVFFSPQKTFCIMSLHKTVKAMFYLDLGIYIKMKKDCIRNGA